MKAAPRLLRDHQTATRRGPRDSPGKPTTHPNPMCWRGLGERRGEAKSRSVPSLDSRPCRRLTLNPLAGPDAGFSAQPGPPFQGEFRRFRAGSADLRHAPLVAKTIRQSSEHSGQVSIPPTQVFRAPAGSAATEPEIQALIENSALPIGVVPSLPAVPWRDCSMSSKRRFSTSCSGCVDLSKLATLAGPVSRGQGRADHGRPSASAVLAPRADNQVSSFSCAAPAAESQLDSRCCGCHRSRPRMLIPRRSPSPAAANGATSP